jgi:hypothetical protein
MAKKGELNHKRQLGMRMDEDFEAALMESAAKNERSLAQEARFALRRYLGLDRPPVEESAGVS